MTTVYFHSEADGATLGVVPIAMNVTADPSASPTAPPDTLNIPEKLFWAGAGLQQFADALSAALAHKGPPCEAATKAALRVQEKTANLSRDHRADQQHQAAARRRPEVPSRGMSHRSQRRRRHRRRRRGVPPGFLEPCHLRAADLDMNGVVDGADLASFLGERGRVRSERSDRGPSARHGRRLRRELLAHRREELVGRDRPRAELLDRA